MVAIYKAGRESSPRIKSASLQYCKQYTYLLLKSFRLRYFAIVVQADYESNQYTFLNEGMEGLLMSFFLVQKCHSSTVSKFMILFSFALSHTLFEKKLWKKENNHYFQW